MANVLFTITFVQAIQAGNTQMLALSKELTLIIVVFKRLEITPVFFNWMLEINMQKYGCKKHLP